MLLCTAFVGSGSIHDAKAYAASRSPASSLSSPARTRHRPCLAPPESGTRSGIVSTYRAIAASRKSWRRGSRASSWQSEQGNSAPRCLGQVILRMSASSAGPTGAILAKRRRVTSRCSGEKAERVGAPVVVLSQGLRGSPRSGARSRLEDSRCRGESPMSSCATREAFSGSRAATRSTGPRAGRGGTCR